jgi:hypothetical protein
VFGWDFLVDEDLNVWLIEVRAVGPPRDTDPSKLSLFGVIQASRK